MSLVMEITTVIDNSIYSVWIKENQEVVLTVNGSSNGVYGLLETDCGDYRWVIDESEPTTGWRENITQLEALVWAAEDFIMTSEDDDLGFDDDARAEQSVVSMLKAFLDNSDQHQDIQINVNAD